MLKEMVRVELSSNWVYYEIMQALLCFHAEFLSGYFFAILLLFSNLRKNGSSGKHLIAKKQEEEGCRRRKTSLPRCIEKREIHATGVGKQFSCPRCL